MSTIELWSQCEYDFEYEYIGNPYTDVELFGIFTNGNIKIKVRGFYAGNKIYKIRFNPQNIGVWELVTESNIPELVGKKESFTCIPTSNNKGRVIVEDNRHFKYQDGTSFFPFGTTSYVWNHQNEKLQKETLKTLKKAPFNKIRMCVFPKYYDYNVHDPEIYPFEGAPRKKNLTKFDPEDWKVRETGFDFSNFNPIFFDQLESQIEILNSMDIQVDLILFHPYDRWGFSVMGKKYDDLYLKYIVARLASFNNIWWSMANEYDLLNKTISDWDDLCKTIIAEDPYQHLLSNHNWYNPPIHFESVKNWYPHQRPWITHLSVQNDRMFNIPKWLSEYNKPFINDECRYEGNLNHGWGNLSAQGMVKQFWEAVCRGGYATHGETYLNEGGIVWWSHGGALIGESPDRIRFLREIVEKNNLKLVPIAYEGGNWETSISEAENGKILIYLGGDSQASYKRFDFLKENCSYEVLLIDTWNMTETPLDYIVQKNSKIELPSTTGMALLLNPISKK